MAEERQKVKIGNVPIPSEYSGWMKFVDKEGDVYVMEPGGSKRDPELQKAVDKVVADVKQKFVNKGKQLRQALSNARAALRSDLSNDSLRGNFDKAKAALEDFRKSRDKQESAEISAAREKVLGK